MNAPYETDTGRRVASTRDEGGAYETYLGRWSRLIAAGFVDWLDIAPGGVWLDVGCGTGALTSAICDMADPVAVTGVDPSLEFVSHATDLSCTDTAGYMVAEASSLPFVDGIYDVAASGLVLNFLRTRSRRSTSSLASSPSPAPSPPTSGTTPRGCGCSATSGTWRGRSPPRP